MKNLAIKTQKHLHLAVALIVVSAIYWARALL